MLDQIPDLQRIRQRILITRQDEGGAHDGFTQFREQRATDLVVRHPQPDRLAFRVDQAPGHFPGGRQDKGIGTRRCHLQEPVGRVVHFRVNAQVRQILAHQRKMVITFQATNPPDTFNRLLVTDMAAQRIG